LTDRLYALRARLVGKDARSFKEELDPDLPWVGAGCYTISDHDGNFVYAGMAGRTKTVEDIAAARANRPKRSTGIRDRLRAHRNGRRSGDQFAVYVFDRFVLQRLRPGEIEAAVAGERSLDSDVKRYIHDHLAYRWVETTSGAEAYALELLLVTEGISGRLPYLNPRKPEES
jgi:hypothetical protein